MEFEDALRTYFAQQEIGLESQGLTAYCGYPSNIVPYSFLGKANLHSPVLILNALVPSNINSTITNHTNLDG